MRLAWTSVGEAEEDCEDTAKKLVIDDIGEDTTRLLRISDEEAELSGRDDTAELLAVREIGRLLLLILAWLDVFGWVDAVDTLEVSTWP